MKVFSYLIIHLIKKLNAKRFKKKNIYKSERRFRRYVTPLSSVTQRQNIVHFYKCFLKISQRLKVFNQLIFKISPFNYTLSGLLCCVIQYLVKFVTLDFVNISGLRSQVLRIRYAKTRTYWLDVVRLSRSCLMSLVYTILFAIKVSWQKLRPTESQI